MPGKNMREETVTFKSGAARSTMDVRWDLLCEEFIRDMAVVMKEGAEILFSYMVITNAHGASK